MSILSTTLLGATNALLWGLPSGKWAALAADKTADLYDQYLRHYQEDFERLIGARIKQIEVSRTQDQDGKIVLVFKNVSVIDFEKLLEQAEGEADKALEGDLRQKLEESTPMQEVAVEQEKVVTDDKEVAKPVETEGATNPPKVADTVYYNVTLTVDSDTTLGEVDFGNWKTPDFGCEVVKQGDNAELTEGERDAVINTLRCYSKLTQKEGFLPQDAINDRIVITDERWVIGWFFNWWHTDKDHAVKQYVDEEKPAPDHVYEEKFINSLKELAIAKKRPELIAGYHQMSQNSLRLRKERNEELIKKYQKQYDEGLIAQRSYRRVLIGATIAAVLVVAAVVALGIAFPTVGISLLSATLGGVATELLHLGRNLNAWLIGGAVAGFFGKFVPEYNAEKLLIARRKLEFQQQLKAELEQEEQGLDEQKRHDLELVENCLGAKESKKLDFSHTNLTPSEINLVIRNFVEKKISLDELTIKMQDLLPGSEPSQNELLKFNDVITKSLLPVSTLTLTAIDPSNTASFETVLAMVQKNCLLTEVHFDWQPRGIDLPQPIENILVQIRQEVLLNQKILAAKTLEELDVTLDARNKLLNNFDLAVCSENAGELVQHVVEQNRCLKQLIADKLPANGAALLQEAAQIEGLRERVKQFWQKLGTERQNALVAQLKSQIKQLSSDQAATVTLLQLCYPSLSEGEINVVKQSFESHDMVGVLDDCVSLKRENDWRYTLMEKIGALHTEVKLHNLIRTITNRNCTVKTVFKELVNSGLEDLLRDGEVKQMLNENTLDYQVLEQFNKRADLRDLFIRVLEGKSLKDLARDENLQKSVLDFLQPLDLDGAKLGDIFGIEESWRRELLGQLLKLRKREDAKLDDSLFQMVWGKKNNWWMSWWSGSVSYVQLTDLSAAIKNDQGIRKEDKIKMCQSICTGLSGDKNYSEEPPKLLMDIIKEYPPLLRGIPGYSKLVCAVENLIKVAEWPLVEELFKNMSDDFISNLELSKGFPWLGRKLVDNLGNDKMVEKIDLPQEVWLKYFEFCGIKPEEAALKADWVSKLFNNFENLTDEVKYVLYWGISWGTGSLSWAPYWNCAQMQAELDKIDPDWQEKYLNKQPTQNLGK